MEIEVNATPMMKYPSVEYDLDDMNIIYGIATQLNNNPGDLSITHHDENASLIVLGLKISVLSLDEFDPEIDCIKDKRNILDAHYLYKNI